MEIAPAPSAPRIVLDPGIRSPLAAKLEAELYERVVGQDQAVRAMSSLYEIALARLNAPTRPIGTMLLLGPTGCGKTRVAESAAEVLFGSAKELVRIDCAEYQHAHEIAKLIGSPPGYVGHGDTAPLLTQEMLDRTDRSGVKLAIVLFDEIEKASPVLWQLLLGVLDRGTLTLGDNRRVDFSRTIVLLSSNLGATEMSAILSGGVGFGAALPASADSTQLADQIEAAAIEAARRHFSPEFMNRLDKTVVFRPLSKEHLEEVLDLELREVQRRVLREDGMSITFRCDDAVRQRLLRDGTDRRYGARHLRRAVERLIVTPLARLLTSGQVAAGDIIDVEIDAETNELVFRKHVLESPVAALVPATAAAAAPAFGDTPDARQLAAALTVTTIAISTAIGLAAGIATAGFQPRR